jgi:hypothetical protein
MKSNVLSLVAALVAIAMACEAEAQEFVGAYAQVTYSVSGQNSDGTSIAPFNLLDKEESFEYAEIGPGEKEVSTDLGTAQVSAFAYAGPRPQARDALLGALVGGSAQLTRPIFNPVAVTPLETGNIEVASSAKARLLELLDFETLGNKDAINVTGFFRLDANLSTSSSRTGPTDPSSKISAFANSRVRVTGNIFAGIAKEQSVLSTTDGFQLSDEFTYKFEPIFFSYTLRPGVPFAVDVTLDASGNLGIGGPHFPIFPAASGTAEYVANISHTLSWGAITSVTNASTGEPVTNWRVTSSSGFDYNQSFPLPEPSSFALVIAAVSICVLRRTRSCSVS